MPPENDAGPRFWSLGHSSLTLDEFLALLGAHHVEALADIRSFPASRRHPHFARATLAAAVMAAGVDYRWFPGLGGRRRPHPDSPHTAWRVEGFRGYADYMGSPEFEQALADMIRWADARRTAFMCAERLWWECHRRLLADRLVTRGFAVEHILDEQRTEPHRLTEFARLEGDRLVYDGGVRALGL